MFGNTKGWILAAIIFIIELAIVGWMVSLDDVTSPTSLSSSENLDLMSLEVSPRTIVPAGSKGDAGSTYRKLISNYEKNRDAYIKFESSGRIGDDRIIEDIRLLADAADERFTNLFLNSPEEIVVYDAKSSPLQSLRVVAQAAINYATLAYKDGKMDAARKFYEATFALGAAMFEERLTYAQASLGLDLMAMSSTGLFNVATKELDQSRIERVKSFKDSLDPKIKLWRDIDNKLLTAKPDLLPKHVGDRIRFAEESKERMWRVEAALGMGLVRTDVGLGARISPADVVASEHALQELAEIDRDNIVKLAAERARSMDKAEATLAIRAVTMQ